MKKPITFLCLISLMAALLSGCGAAPAQPSPSAPADTGVAVRIGALTGPTAMGLVKLFSDADSGAGANEYEYTLAGSADELTPMILQGELDIASVPANLASVLYGKTDGGVEMLAVDVLGVLYVCEYNGGGISSVSDLRGKTLYATGKGSTPEYFLRYILSENGLDPDADVTIEWKSEPGEVVALLEAEGSGIAMLPQPYVTAARAKLGDGFSAALSVSEQWEALGGGSLCVTAGIIVRTQFAADHPEAVAAFLEEFADSAAWVNENPGQAAALCEEYGIAKAAVAEKAIPQCNIVCITGADMKAALSGCLDVLYRQNPASVGGALPGDDFYYGA